MDTTIFNGYREGNKYTKELKLVKISGNRNNLFLHFEDEDACSLSWLTSARVSIVNHLEIGKSYKLRFRVSENVIILNTTHIKNLNFEDKGDNENVNN